MRIGVCGMTRPRLRLASPSPTLHALGPAFGWNLGSFGTSGTPEPIPPKLLSPASPAATPANIGASSGDDCFEPEAELFREGILNDAFEARIERVRAAVTREVADFVERVERTERTERAEVVLFDR
jgi:hypothetical protein